MKLIGDGVGRRIERCLLIPRGERQGRRERKGLSSLTQCENGVKADKELLHLAVIKVRAKVFFSGRDNVAQVNTIFSLLPSCLQPCQELWWGKQREKREKRAWASPRQLQPTNCPTFSLMLLWQNIIYASQVSAVYFSVSSTVCLFFFLNIRWIYRNLFRPWVTTTAAESMEEEEEEEEEAISDY